ncbi:MAG: hypothetical protein Q9184_007532 [Pyrenodesmia sp. 2 TL-2023]
MAGISPTATEVANSSLKSLVNAHILSAPLTRSSTKGPLDTDDPLAPPNPSTSTPTTEEAAGVPIPPTPSSQPSALFSPQSLLPERPRSRSPAIPRKSFSFLLRPENFVPIPQTDIPPSFLSHAPPPNTPLPTLLRQGHYLPAAFLAAKTLTSTSNPLSPAEIFSLLYTRLACLALTNHTAIAAQESLILGDIHSPFYASDAIHPSGDSTTTEGNILPWHLRVLATRLQALGAGDARRAVQGYYDLGAYARSQHKASTTTSSKELWNERLKDLGYRTGNALIEMGDLSGARRFFESLVTTTAHADADSKTRILEGWIAMLSLRTGDLESARKWIHTTHPIHPTGETTDNNNNNNNNNDDDNDILRALLSMAESNYPSAISAWRALQGTKHHILATHNLAVCLVYTGQLSETTPLLESLLNAGHNFHALTFNLSTIYELRTEHAREKKLALAGTVAGMLREQGRDEDGKSVERGVGDFKL